MDFYIISTSLSPIRISSFIDYMLIFKYSKFKDLLVTVPDSRIKGRIYQEELK